MADLCGAEGVSVEGGEGRSWIWDFPDRLLEQKQSLDTAALGDLLWLPQMQEQRDPRVWLPISCCWRVLNPGFVRSSSWTLPSSALGRDVPLHAECGRFLHP